MLMTLVAFSLMHAL